MPLFEARRRRPAARLAQGQIAEAPAEDRVMDLARKLVGLAREQHRALDLGAREQFAWAGLRRDEVTERLSCMLAAQVPVSAEEAGELETLRTDMLALDRAMQERLKTELQALATRRRVFARNKKALGSYLTAGPRRGFFDQQR